MHSGRGFDSHRLHKFNYHETKPRNIFEVRMGPALTIHLRMDRASNPSPRTIIDQCEYLHMGNQQMGPNVDIYINFANFYWNRPRGSLHKISMPIRYDVWTV